MGFVNLLQIKRYGNFRIWQDEDENTFTTEPEYDFMMPFYNLNLIAKFQSTVSVKQPNPVTVFNVFPNPSQGVFRVTVAEEMDFSVLDLTGRIIKSGSFKAENNQLDLSGNKPGLFFLNFINRNQKLTQRIVIY